MVFQVKDALFAVAATLVVQASNTVVRCGLDRLQSNSCVIEEGTIPLAVFGSPMGVEFYSLTMRGLSEVSVMAARLASADARFVDCEWLASSFFCSRYFP